MEATVFAAASAGDAPMLASILIENQALMNARDLDGKTPLFHALAMRRTHCVEVTWRWRQYGSCHSSIHTAAAEC